jgi:hypothetical protein
MKKLCLIAAIIGFVLCFSLLTYNIKAENFCCNPVTYVCEDCGFCPNVYGEYKVWDEKAKQMGRLVLTDEGAGVIGMKLCFPLGKSGKDTCYIAALTR